MKLFDPRWQFMIEPPLVSSSQSGVRQSCIPREGVLAGSQPAGSIGEFEDGIDLVHHGCLVRHPIKVAQIDLSSTDV